MSINSISEKQLAANRRNALKSTGPKSESGKSRSAINAFKHGRYSVNAPVLRGEDSIGFNELLHSFIDRFRPQDPIEMSLVRKLASADWRICRLMAIESRSIDIAVTDLDSPYLSPQDQALAYPESVTKALAKQVDKSKLPRFLGDRERQLTQVFHATLKQLLFLRARSERLAPHVEPLDSEDLRLLDPPENEPISNPQLVDSSNGTNPISDQN